jgi:hypothetical protein
VTPVIHSDFPEVLLVQVVPLSYEVGMLPEPTTETNNPVKVLVELSVLVVLDEYNI